MSTPDHPQVVIETSRALKLYFDRDNAAGITTVKPRVFFGKLEHRFGRPTPMEIYVPSSGIGSITLLEAAILVSILNIIEPKNIFEFGTFLGYSSSLFLKNTGPKCNVYSIDLGENLAEYEKAKSYSLEELHADDKKNDDYLRYVQGSKGTYYLADLSDEERARLRLLQGDSTKLDLASKGYSGAFDFVFIDGGHDTATIASDTENALEMIGGDGLIAWHDYKSPIHSDVTDYVDRLSADHAVIHVQSTMLALLPIGVARTRFLQLAAD